MIRKQTKSTPFHRGVFLYKEVISVPWWLIMIIGAAAAIFVIDWLIVMGADPRKWKGGKGPH